LGDVGAHRIGDLMLKSSGFTLKVVVALMTRWIHHDGAFSLIFLVTRAG
jgi:hypothetical protein